MTEFLLSITGIDVNATNLNGMTPMDILIERRMDTKDLDIEESLKRARGFVPREILNGSTRKKKKNQALFIDPLISLNTLNMIYKEQSTRS